MALPQQQQTTPVRSMPISQARAGSNLYALAIVLFIFGVMGWIAGGKYTVEGWIVALNMFARWIGIDQQLATPRGWWLVAAVGVSGLVYSRVELLAWRKNAQRLPTFWIGWVLIVITDVGSTLIGVLNPAPGSAPIFHQLAALPVVAIVWALILTAAPEYLILGAYRIVKR